VLLNIAFAGASELVREVGMDWMSQDLAARLSARAAQGIGAGLLTARLGIKAMELCRPLPWIADDKPRLGDFRRELIGQLKETLQKSKTGRRSNLRSETLPGGGFALPGLEVMMNPGSPWRQFHH
jgi:putative membrane protein